MSLTKHRLYHVIRIFFVLCLFACKQEGPVDDQQDNRNTREQLIEVNRILVKKDQQRIKGYLERQNMEMNESETGLWYAIEAIGEGPKAETGKRATINYTVGLLDGSECYSSNRDGSKTFTIGRGGVESGLEEGLLMLNEGGKASFIMPPHLAHGLPGDGNCIPARAIIVYHIHLISID